MQKADVSTTKPEEQTEFVTQVTYRSTSFEDVGWEVVGERYDNDNFEPMPIENIVTEGFSFDPMFADYGGIPEGEQRARWHLPENAQYQGSQKTRKMEEAEEHSRLARERHVQEIEQIKRTAEEQGRQRALAEVAEGQQKQYEQARLHCEGMLRDLVTQQQEQILMLERHAVELAIELSKKIVETTVEINPEYIIAVVREALQHIGSSVVKKVRVSPGDMEFINVVGLGKSLKEFENSLQFEADESVKAGCIVETSAGELDFELGRAWDRVKEDCMKVLR